MPKRTSFHWTDLDERESVCSGIFFDSFDKTRARWRTSVEKTVAGDFVGGGGGADGLGHRARADVFHVAGPLSSANFHAFRVAQQGTSTRRTQ